MRKMIVSTPLLVFAVALLFAAAFMAVPAVADSAHFVSGPTCNISLTTGLTCTGKVAGLGTTPDSVFLTDTLTTATYVCHNKGGNVAAGQPIQTPSQSGPPGSITASGGNIIFSATLPVPPAPNPTGCPNGNWTLVLTSVTYNGVSVHFTKGGVDVTGSPLSIGTFSAP
jgi:hypothetical protein